MLVTKGTELRERESFLQDGKTKMKRIECSPEGSKVKTTSLLREDIFFM